MDKHNIYLAIVTFTTIVFVLWSSFFIYKTSFIIDGNRYYSLFDDAMISMKYAWQLVHGHGLVWNNLDRVEGYTNPLWTIFMSPFIAFLNPQHAVLAIQILGIFIILAISFVTIKIASMTKFIEKKYENLQSCITILLLLTYYPLLYWTLMGMETGLLTLLILTGIYFSLRYVKNQKLSDGYLLSLFLILAYLTRPDSFFVTLAIFAGVLVLSLMNRKKRKIIKRLIGVVAVYLLVIVLHVLFRKYFYGEFVPNTVTLKVFGLSTRFRIENGFGFILPFIWETMLTIIFAVIAVIYHRNSIKFFFLFLFFVECIYQIFVGGDSWNYWRFLVPLMPLVFILSSTFIVDAGKYLLDKKIFRKIHNEYALIFLCFIVTFGLIYANNYRFIKQLVFTEGISQVEYNVINTNFALRLKELTKPNATVGVIWAGAIPYYSERDGIDFLGKSDKYIARLKPDLTVFTSVYGMKTLPGHNKYDLEYSIIKLKPDVIERADWANQSVYTHPDFNYETIKYKRAILYVRKNSKNVYWGKIKK